MSTQPIMNHDFEDNDNLDDDSDIDYGPSKSELKREAQATLALTKRLCDLSDNQLEKLGLDEDVRQGIALARSIKAHGGKQRQLKLVAKMLREIDRTELEKHIQHIDQTHQDNVAEFHHLEKLRDSLIAGDKSALTELINQHPEVNNQQLRQLVRAAQKESEPNKKHRRALFQFLKTL